MMYDQGLIVQKAQSKEEEPGKAKPVLDIGANDMVCNKKEVFIRVRRCREGDTRD